MKVCGSGQVWDRVCIRVSECVHGGAGNRSEHGHEYVSVRVVVYMHVRGRGAGLLLLCASSSLPTPSRALENAV